MISRAPLARHGREVSSVFDLLGRKENDLTAALAFTLGRSPALLGLILRRLVPGPEDEEAVLRLEAPDALGRTDLEISTPSRLIIVEAKRGWLLPGETQLGKYAPRIAAHGAGALGQPVRRERAVGRHVLADSGPRRARASPPLGPGQGRPRRRPRGKTRPGTHLARRVQ